jgi:hypothetical protein
MIRPAADIIKEAEFKLTQGVNNPRHAQRILYFAVEQLRVRARALRHFADRLDELAQNIGYGYEPARHEAWKEEADNKIYGALQDLDG